MELFFQTSLTFPVVLFSFLLCAVFLYWLIAAVGIFEIDALDADISLDGEGIELEGLAGLLMKLGLGGVPVTLVLSLLIFFAWVACYLIEMFVLRYIAFGWLRYPLGLLSIGLALVPAVPITAALCRPLRPLFQKLQSTTRKSVLGQTAVVRSGRVTLQHGEVTLEDGGAGLILRVRADESCGFKRGDRVVLLEYLEAEHAYRVVSEDEFNGL
ncbi:hypothetical protein [Pseudomonas sp. EA_35y_Pfl2_R5]|uniref:hypothetical protein n=1 Tax=Pseudomonas sp. EA_35y_Pfl2_R5 TaxID=3088690 RepID=UPI0030DBDDCC